MSLKLYRSRAIEYCYVILLAFALIYKIGYFGPDPYFINTMYLKNLLIVSCLFAIWALLTYIYRKGKKSTNKYVKEGKFYFKIFFGLQLLFEIYAIFLVLIGKADSSWISTNLVSILTTIAFISSVYLFKERAILLYIYAIVINLYITIFVNCITNGPNIILMAIESFIGIGPTAGVFEVHDNSFAIGLLLMYCIFNKDISHRKFLIFSLFFGVVLGQKRIEFAAILIVFLIYIFDGFRNQMRIKKRVGYRFLAFLMAISVLFCFVYVKISLDGTLNLMFQKYGINSMNRNSFYSAMADYATFSPSYLGIGRNAAGYVIGHYYGYGVVNIHNDILKMYVENGFWLFLIWLLVNLVILPLYSVKKFSYEAGIKTIMIIIFTFICYSTDNIESYFSVQLALMLTLLFTNLECKGGILNGFYKKRRRNQIEN